MRFLLLCAACWVSLAGISRAQSPDFPFDTTPAPGGGVWIGWDEIPCVYPPVVELPTTRIEVITFLSPVVPLILEEIKIRFQRVPAKASKPVVIRSTPPARMVPKLGPAQLADWTAFFRALGGNDAGSENHFSKTRAELIKRAETDGITPALLHDCEALRAEMEAVRGDQ